MTKKFAEEEKDYFSVQDTLLPEDRKLYTGGLYRQASRHNKVCDMLQPIGVQSVLDVGCGLSDLLPTLKARNPTTLQRYQGCDIMPQFVSQAAGRYKDMDGMAELTWSTSTVFDLNKPDESFCAVVAIDIFTKFTDDYMGLLCTTVAEMWRLAKHAIVFTTLSPNMRRNPKARPRYPTLNYWQ